VPKNEFAGILPESKQKLFGPTKRKANEAAAVSTLNAIRTA
jgi:hypothetical protein